MKEVEGGACGFHIAAKDSQHEMMTASLIQWRRQIPQDFSAFYGNSELIGGGSESVLRFVIMVYWWSWSICGFENVVAVVVAAAVAVVVDLFVL